MNGMNVKKVIECLLFFSEKPLSPDKISEILAKGREGMNVDSREVEELLIEMGEEYRNRDSGLQIVRIGGGFQMCSLSECAPWIRVMFKSRITLKLSPSAMETLSIIVYKQPITKGEIEGVRGVDAGGVLHTLLSKKLIRICGRKDVPGRPLLYKTTQKFLQYFGLRDLLEMPSLEEINVE
ncbi:SMC-Scp complex subunit ScpB [bacterium]|nr:SMC-Scp complex subunit ScpB [bacterium]